LFFTSVSSEYTGQESEKEIVATHFGGQGSNAIHSQQSNRKVINNPLNSNLLKEKPSSSHVQSRDGKGKQTKDRSRKLLFFFKHAQ